MTFMYVVIAFLFIVATVFCIECDRLRNREVVLKDKISFLKTTLDEKTRELNKIGVNLRSSHLVFWIEEGTLNKSAHYLYARDKCSNVMFLIKSFDDENKLYNYNCAVELKEKLEEKI